MASLLSLFNRVLPFATPGTPLLQDLVHLAAICLLLYFAPAIQDWHRARSQQATTHAPVQVDNQVNGEPRATNVQQPQDEHTNETTGAGEADGDHRNFVNGQAGPANVPHDGDVDEDGEQEDDDDIIEDGVQNQGRAQRNIGAKKAKSLARKDQRKAYNEFMRSQGDAQRARDAEGAAEREAALEAERKRRALAEAELDAKKAREREQKREAEKAEREAEYRRREAVVALVKADLEASNLSDLHRIAVQVGGDVDEEWVEKVLNSSGLIGQKDNILTIITSTGWAARISREHAMALYVQGAQADINDAEGYIDHAQLSSLFVSILNTPLVTSAA